MAVDEGFLPNPVVIPCLAISNFYGKWNFHAKVANPMINSLKVYHDDSTTLVSECYKGLVIKYRKG